MTGIHDFLSSGVAPKFDVNSSPLFQSMAPLSSTPLASDSLPSDPASTPLDEETVLANTTPPSDPLSDSSSSAQHETSSLPRSRRRGIESLMDSLHQGIQESRTRRPRLEGQAAHSGNGITDMDDENFLCIMD